MAIKLNEAQKAAVEQTDGPLLVLAGPGTGKTQLLSARVARILEKTDTLAENILCLTFTEKGAANMLERLASFIGQEAYNVNISTYHAFGGELIRRYPQYFDGELEASTDELSQHEILSQIIEKLSYHNPLKSLSYHLGNLISTISEVKQALLSTEELRAIASENASFLADANSEVSKIFDGLTRMPTKLSTASGCFEKTLALLNRLSPAKPANTHYQPLAVSLADSLAIALESANIDNSTKPLTAWKNKYLIKNSDNEFILAGELEAKKLTALADIIDSYKSELARRRLYDFDDMIIKTISALESNDDFKFTLQEKYQYILLDEYQDTNAAQARLVQLMTDNPVNEGRPNVMAVGDDDQAIYAFQGAEASNLADFAASYKDTKIISLTENYRSHATILDASANIAGQISDRASSSLQNVKKQLTAAGKVNDPVIIRREFLSGPAELDWVANRIEKLITENDIRPSQIAVLAPRHKSLEPLVPFLNKLDIPVRYEKRENILKAPVIQQLLAMSRLTQSLAEHNEELANSLWPEVLSYEFWSFELADIWEISWQDERFWTKKLLASKKFRWVALFFMQLASMATTETLETMLDYLIGSQQLKISDKIYPNATSPLKKHYTSPEAEADHPDIFYRTISNLTVLRKHLRDRQASTEQPLKLADLIELARLYETSNTRMINTSPYNQAAESVQLMTVFKAKGLEFEHVFLLSCQDEIWGASARSNSNKLTLPANLSSIRRVGTSDDERLRILFVALTRAKSGLYLTSFQHAYNGKPTTRLKYLDEREQNDGKFRSFALPEKYQTVLVSSNEVPELATLETNWQNRHFDSLSQTKLADLLTERVKKYQLSPTHLNTFIDLSRGGPRAFLLNTLLRFPQAPSSAGQFGNAIHETLEWYQLKINAGLKPNHQTVLEDFERRMKSKKLAADETERLIERGKIALTAYLNSASFNAGDLPEVKFKNEGVFVGEAHLGGKIDKLELNPEAKTIQIVDYKTGTPSDHWKSELKFHKYKQQLYIYKLLIEHSSSYKGWTVAGERLDFIEPDHSGKCYSLELKFNQKEFDEITALITAMWQKVITLAMPDISRYSADFAGSKLFEQDLINGKC